MGCVVLILKVKVISAVKQKGLACETRYMVGYIWWVYVGMVGICWNVGYMVECWVYGGMLGIWWVWSIDNIPSLWCGGIFEQRA